MNEFEVLGLSPAIVAAVAKMGFETPTPIQQKSIPLLLSEQRDIIALAQTGTGKTAAFGLPLIQLLNETKPVTQALILAPTRELSLQITNELENFSKDVKPFNIVTVYGGASITDQIRKVRRGAHIIVATPGRLIDLLSRKVVQLSDIKYLVLDEADEMLNMGFKEDIDEILKSVSSDKKIWLFSATMPEEVRSISKNYMRSPIEISVAGSGQGNENIEHQYVLVDDRNKYLALKRLVDYAPEMFGVIFCRTKADTQRVADSLMKDGYNADALHGDLSQAQRDRVTLSFRNKTIQLLVATDVAARGIDISNITHVLHMNMPDEKEFYIHRSGRTARAGKRGISLAIISQKEVGKIRQVEKTINRRFTKIEIPSGTEVCEKKLMDIVHRMRTVEIMEEEMDSFLPEVYHELKDLSKEDIIKRFAALEFNRFLAYYRDAKDLNKTSKSSFQSEEDGTYDSSGTRVFINIGKMDGLDKGALISLICDFGGITGSQIGKIDLKGAYSFFEIEEEVFPKIQQGFEGVEVRGRKVRLELTGGGGQKKRSSEAPFRRSGNRSGGNRPYSGGGRHHRK